MGDTACTLTIPWWHGGIVTITYTEKYIATQVQTIQNYTLWTDHSCVLPVITVMDTNSIVSALKKVRLIPSAAHIIQEDRSRIMMNASTNSNCCCVCKVYQHAFSNTTVTH